MHNSVHDCHCSWFCLLVLLHCNIHSREVNLSWACSCTSIQITWNILLLVSTFFLLTTVKYWLLPLWVKSIEHYNDPVDPPCKILLRYETNSQPILYKTSGQWSWDVVSKTNCAQSTLNPHFCQITSCLRLIIIILNLWRPQLQSTCMTKNSCWRQVDYIPGILDAVVHSYDHQQFCIQ